MDNFSGSTIFLTKLWIENDFCKICKREMLALIYISPPNIFHRLLFAALSINGLNYWYLVSTRKPTMLDITDYYSTITITIL